MSDAPTIGVRLGAGLVFGAVALVGVALMPSAAIGQTEARLGPLNPVDASRLRESAIEVLLEMTNSEDAQVRANAIEGLLPAPARLATVLPAALRDQNLGVRTVATMAVGRAKLDQYLPVVRELEDDPSGHVRAAAVYAMRRCGDDVNPTPLGQMATQDPSALLRAHAAFLLGELGDEGTVPLLRDASQRSVPRATAVENKVLQVQIAEALVKLGDTEQLHSLRAALFPASAEELDATVLAIQVLAGLDDRASLGQLRSLGRQLDPQGNPMPIEVRLSVAGALGALGVSEFEPMVLGALEQGTLPQRVQAAWAAGQIGSTVGVRALEEHMAEGPERLRVASAAAVLQAVERK